MTAKLTLQIFIVTLFIILSNSLIVAQVEEQKVVLYAEPFDRFARINSESLSARLDSFAVTLQSDSTTKGFVVVYRPQNQTLGFPYRYAARIYTYLTRQRGFSSDRIVTKVGGMVAEPRNELWVISANITNAPVISPPFDIKEAGETNKTFLFDSYDYTNIETLNRLFIDGCCSIDTFDSEEAYASLSAFAELLKKNPTTKGF